MSEGSAVIELLAGPVAARAVDKALEESFGLP